MGFKCNSSIQACALRIGRQLEDGRPAPGANGLYVTDALIKIGWKINVKKGANFNQPNGCGTTCITFQDDDEMESVDLAMEVCLLDAELLEICGVADLVAISGVNRGWKLPVVGQKLSNRVSVEAWSKAWDVDAQATNGGDALYHHWVWPSVSWILGDSELSNNPLAVPLAGHGRSNANIFDGPANDLPSGEFTTPMGSFVDDGGLPLTSCGYQEVLAS